MKPRTTPWIEELGKALVLSAGIVLIMAGSCWALEPKEVLVVANKDVSASVSLAKYYMNKRGIPAKNLLALSASGKEHLRGGDYEKDIAVPVRQYLKDKDPFRFIRCLLIMYGLPLKVNRAKAPQTKAELEKLKTQRGALKKQLRDTKDRNQKGSLNEALDEIKQRITALEKADGTASLDSEIALVLEGNYDLAGWVPNPLFIGYRGKRIEGLPWEALMVARLDGPSPEIVRRMIDDTVLAEQRGLEGTAYFDARWPEPKERKASGYAFYDQSIHRAARVVKKTNMIPVVLNDEQRLFEPGDCPQAALYCGWYSLAKYVDAFQWQPGAVGYHIASAECKTLKKQGSHVWCKRMIEKGVAATMGPVGEPYVEAFPLPEIFFALLVEGKLTLAECFAASNPFWSWKMVLIGDPLYRPFKNVVTGAVAPDS